jgi:putative protein kinase ArgK-like GTPase of G3E family
LARALDAHLESLHRAGSFETRRRSGLRAQVQGLAESVLREILWEGEGIRGALEREVDAVLAGERDPATAARLLAERLRGGTP